MFQSVDPTTAIVPTLKLKYRNPARLLRRTGVDPIGGTLVYSYGTKKTKTGGNSGAAGKVTSSVRPRRRAYGPW